MRGFRWDLVLAAALLALGLAVFGLTRRWTPLVGPLALDRMTGRICRFYAGTQNVACFRPQLAPAAEEHAELYRPPRADSPEVGGR